MTLIQQLESFLSNEKTPPNLGLELFSALPQILAHLKAAQKLREDVAGLSKKCIDPQGNALCTNGEDTYHEWNVRHSDECFYCGKWFNQALATYDEAIKSG